MAQRVLLVLVSSPPRLALASILIPLALSGCGTVKQTGTVRTGTEQLLLTNAWDKAISKIDFRPLAGVPVFLDTTNVTSVDQGWVVSSLRQSMLTQGVLLRPKVEQAQFVVEARVGAYGTDSYNWMIGVPQITVPPSFTGVPTGTVPEIPIIKKTDQQAVAKLALFAYDRAGGQVVWTSGTQLETANAKDTYIGGLGPIQSGSIRGGTEFVGVKIPLTSENEAPTPGSKALKNNDRFSGAVISPNQADLDAFRP